MQLSDLGWNSFFEQNFEKYKTQGLSAMRIIRENREKYIACCELGEFSCEISGKFRFDTDSKSEFPAVGDWVVTSVIPNEMKAIIHALLPRKSVFSRKVAGQITDEQVIAANIDIVFIITGLDLNYNLRRIERFLSIAWESKALPVILLNKADLCPEAELRKTEVESVAIGVDVYTLSATQNIGIDILNQYIQRGKTIAFLGSSGVGKSTIINSLLGMEHLKMNEVSELGSRGRHTTTYRELIVLPSGGMVIDTPGMRELQVWGDEEGLKYVFDDIEKLSLNCRYRNCSHENEPDCAVQNAISNGSLDPKRLESFLKLKKEFKYLENRQTMKASAIEKANWKTISKLAKNIKKNKL
ncbi:ribosome small subunit-dependent GTPase A [Leptospira vanthielii]|uniref:Small ribosomal subunit biogenesis GTPase RsgA n=1 Tax=Leptospira vanthielii serovar Holland str. Waz Holland = ATCC 700522 TaxID=1218591 RepID=N1W756_9LEPT|nr:ribosome small subunit-dependent GTPase A [Leptospira vanthielii]EMY70833.1 ribosome small subunit-dependent GTPase A [Leptospira vanthielii serovar Holland str. Waz Holland = ATCC 700522]